MLASANGSKCVDLRRHRPRTGLLCNYGLTWSTGGSKEPVRLEPVPHIIKNGDGEEEHKT